MTLRRSYGLHAEQPGEFGQVGQLLTAAFGRPLEASLVERLRADGDFVLALVAEQGNTIVGYAAWPRLWIEMPNGASPAVALAPLAVSPLHQGQGIGSALTRAGLRQLRDRGEDIVFVLGDPVYYRRFGFSVAAGRAYDSRYAGGHFMALRLGAHAPESGSVRYPVSFNTLD